MCQRVEALCRLDWQVAKPGPAPLVELEPERCRLGLVRVQRCPANWTERYLLSFEPSFFFFSRDLFQAECFLGGLFLFGGQCGGSVDLCLLLVFGEMRDGINCLLCLRGEAARLGIVSA